MFLVLYFEEYSFGISIIHLKQTQPHTHVFYRDSCEYKTVALAQVVFCFVQISIYFSTFFYNFIKPGQQQHVDHKTWTLH